MKKKTLLQNTGNKYGAKPTYIDGIRFDSGSEGTYYRMLKRRLDQGEIKSFERQVTYKLHDEVGLFVRKYIADYVITNLDDTFEVIDVKSPITRNLKKFRDNERLMLLNHGIKIQVKILK